MNLNKANVITNKNNSKPGDGNPSTSKQRPVIAEETQARRFEPHQLPIKGSARRVKDLHNIFTCLDEVTGPMLALRNYMKEQRRVRVLVRHEHGIRGTLEGLLVFYDKFWNLWLRDVDEVWQRRKYKYGVNKMCGQPQDCAWRLQELGIQLPTQQVKSINRKNVEIRRHLPQLFLRGEHVALVFLLPENATKTKMNI